MTEAQCEQLRKDERDLAAILANYALPPGYRLPADCFSDPIARAIIDAAESLERLGKPVATKTVMQELSDSGACEKIDGGLGTFGDYLTDFQNQNIPDVIAAELRDRVRNASQTRALIGAHTKAVEALSNGTLPGEAEARFKEATENQLQFHHMPPAWIEAKTPGELAAYDPPESVKLIGDFHITKGGIFVIGGKPGIGKSMATIYLAVCGAEGRAWFGLETHRPFKTLIIQNENGSHRLHQQFSELNSEHLDDWIRVTPPPPYGLAFDDPQFRAELKRIIAEFKPDIVILDPWNGMTRDGNERDYSEALRNLRLVIPAGDDSPAIGIVAHLRKKQAENARGTALLDELSGSLKLGSVARTAFVLQGASSDTEDSRVVFTCCKNNDGDKGARSAWIRGNGHFEAVEDFDWEAFDGGNQQASVIDEFALQELFDEHGPMTRAKLAKRLEAKTGKKKSTCYGAVKKLARYFREESGLLHWGG